MIFVTAVERFIEQKRLIIKAKQTIEKCITLISHLTHPHPSRDPQDEDAKVQALQVENVEKSQDRMEPQLRTSGDQERLPHLR